MARYLLSVQLHHGGCHGLTFLSFPRLHMVPHQEQHHAKRPNQLFPLGRVPSLEAALSPVVIAWFAQFSDGLWEANGLCSSVQSQFSGWNTLRIIEIFEPSWTILDHLGPFWTILDQWFFTSHGPQHGSAIGIAKDPFGMSEILGKGAPPNSFRSRNGVSRLAMEEDVESAWQISVAQLDPALKDVQVVPRLVADLPAGGQDGLNVTRLFQETNNINFWVLCNMREIYIYIIYIYVYLTQTMKETGRFHVWSIKPQQLAWKTPKRMLPTANWSSISRSLELSPSNPNSVGLLIPTLATVRGKCTKI